MLEAAPDWQATLRVPSIICEANSTLFNLSHSTTAPFELTGDVCNCAAEAKLSCAIAFMRCMANLEREMLEKVSKKNKNVRINVLISRSLCKISPSDFTVMLQFNIDTILGLCFCTVEILALKFKQLKTRPVRHLFPFSWTSRFLICNMYNSLCQKINRLRK